MASQQQTSPWVYVGIGCTAVLVLLIALGGACAYFTYRTVENVRELNFDPEKRRESTLELLDATDLPDGYHPSVTFSIPFLVDAVILTDRPPDKEGSSDGFDDRAFAFARVRPIGDAEEDIRDFIEGRRDNLDFIQTDEIRINRGALINRGEFEYREGTVRFTAHRARVRSEGEIHPSVVAVFQVECPDTSRLRVGAWVGPSPEAVAEEDEDVDLSLYRNTPADEQMLKSFLENFYLCSG